MPYSNISAALTGAQITAINTALDTIFTTLAFGINLTNEERQTLAKPGDDKLPFMIKVMQYANSNAALRPAFASLPEAQKDEKLNTDLQPIDGRINQLLEIVQDTRLATQVELYDYCRLFYNNVQEAAKRNVPGSEAIYMDLKQYFDLPPQGNTTTPVPNP
jgi:hypothetical protein